MIKSNRAGNPSGASEKSSNVGLNVATALLGQLPSGLVAFGYERFSIYQPTFYREKEPFLVIPLLVGFFATWAVMRNHRAMGVIFIFAIVAAIANYGILEFVSLQNRIHTANWILSYCTFALAVAVAMRSFAEVLGLKPSKLPE